MGKFLEFPQKSKPLIKLFVPLYFQIFIEAYSTRMDTKIFFLLILLAVPSIDAGPIAYAICQTGCNFLAVACYGAAGAIFGTGKEFLITNISGYHN